MPAQVAGEAAAKILARGARARTRLGHFTGADSAWRRCKVRCVSDAARNEAVDGAHAARNLAKALARGKRILDDLRRGAQAQHVDPTRWCEDALREVDAVLEQATDCVEARELRMEALARLKRWDAAAAFGADCDAACRGAGVGLGGRLDAFLRADPPADVTNAEAWLGLGAGGAYRPRRPRETTHQVAATPRPRRRRIVL